MGLDMHLTAKRYVGDWDHTNPAERARYRAVAEAAGFGGLRCDGSPHLEVEMSVMYWRKANAIHAWFVRECGGGVDDCRPVYVEREKLTELAALCRHVLGAVETVEGAVNVGTTYYPDGRVVQETIPGAVVAQPEVAAELLPTQGGFFFGKTDYDKDYLSDLRDTADGLEALLANDALKGCEFEYRASW